MELSFDTVITDVVIRVAELNRMLTFISFYYNFKKLHIPHLVYIKQNGNIFNWSSERLRGVGLVNFKLTSIEAVLTCKPSDHHNADGN